MSTITRLRPRQSDRVRKLAGYYVDGYEYTFVGGNSDKWYRAYYTSDRPEWALVAWGRRGAAGTAMVTSRIDAERRIDEKTRKGYQYERNFSFVVPWSEPLDTVDAIETFAMLKKYES
jgi:predicted DNA-binding WGR domain protein